LLYYPKQRGIKLRRNKKMQTQQTHKTTSHDEYMTNATVGNIVPIVREIEMQQGFCPLEYFAKLSDYGRTPNSFLLESKDIVPKYGEVSIGSADPCLKIIGRGSQFEITALNSRGERDIASLKQNNAFDFCDKVEYSGASIIGELELLTQKTNLELSENERLKQTTHMDILRRIAFHFNPTTNTTLPFAGLFGAFAYDFIDQFEKLPPYKKPNTTGSHDPDYEFFFADNVFVFDHKTAKLKLFANAMLTDDNYETHYTAAIAKLDELTQALEAQVPAPREFPSGKKGTITTDTSSEQYREIVKTMKEHVNAGDVFQIVPSRTLIADTNSEELDIYRKLRALNPSPYMFYIRNEESVLLGASPEMCIRIQGDEEKRQQGNNESTIEIRPIAGTRKRGIVDGHIDHDLDSKMAVSLLTDEKEKAEHLMLVDLARNDVARVCIPGTSHCDEPLIVERYSHVMHLVSNVRGTLRPELDALHAYLATTPMGTLTGAPKPRAMELLRQHETRRGLYAGTVGYLTPTGDFDSCIVIRSMRIKANKAYVRAGAGIVYDSIPENEDQETLMKAAACLKAAELAGNIEYKAVGFTLPEKPKPRISTQSEQKISRVLFLDNFDSFVRQLEAEFLKLRCTTEVYRNNVSMQTIDQAVQRFDPELIVLSPGPSTPNDAGCMLELIAKYHDRIPIFGVCLGHQAIIQHFGGRIARAPVPVHGKTSHIHLLPCRDPVFAQDPIFTGLSNPMIGARYHSLHGIYIKFYNPEDPTRLLDTAITFDRVDGKDGKKEQMITMGVRHEQHPIVGIQFHPESILTPQGPLIIKNIVDGRLRLRSKG